MATTIMDLIDAGLQSCDCGEMDPSLIQKVFQLRYASHSRSRSKFSSISAAVARSGQTVRNTVVRTWAHLPNVREIIAAVAEEIATVMTEQESASISPALLVGRGVFAGCTGDDLITLVHDMTHYVDKGVEMPVFVVRKHGTSSFSVLGHVDKFRLAGGRRFEPVALPPKALSAVHLAKTMDGTGSLSVDVIKLAEAIGSPNAAILADRIGVGSNGSSTLAKVGEIYGVTRERIRQVTVSLLRQIMSVEFAAGGGPITELKKICNQISFKQKQVVALTDVISANPYLKGFTGNEKGLFILMVAADIGNVIQNAGFYIHQTNISPDHALHDVAALKAATTQRRGRASEHQQMMSVLPLDLIADARKLARHQDLSANMFYSGVLEKFCCTKPTSLPVAGDIEWSSVGDSWRMVNMRLSPRMISDINSIAERVDVSRAALVYSVIKHEVDQAKHLQ